MSETGNSLEGVQLPRAYAQQGFTLIETLVAVAVAALIAGLSFPQVQQSLAALRFRSSVSEVSAILQDARARAIGRGRHTEVRVNAAARNLAIDTSPSVMLNDGTRFLGKAEPIVFFADGSSTGGLVTIGDSTGRQATFRVAADTGEIGLLQ